MLSKLKKLVDTCQTYWLL